MSVKLTFLILMLVSVYAETPSECVDSCGKWCLPDATHPGICEKSFFVSCPSYYNYDVRTCIVKPAFFFIVKVLIVIFSLFILLGCIVVCIELCRKGRQSAEKLAKECPGDSNDVVIAMVLLNESDKKNCPSDTSDTSSSDSD